MPRAAVLGKPIEHSLSPPLHRAAYTALGLTDWTYTRHQVDAQGLPPFVDGLGENWRGLSLTMPCKEAALLLAHSASQVALQTGAVNTLVRAQEGWVGDNTDVAGISRALVEAGVGASTPAPCAAIIGSGATARSALAALAGLGTREVTFLVRTRARESTPAQARDHGFEVTVQHLSDAVAVTTCLRAPVLVSTAPAGSADGLATAIARAGAPAVEGAVWLDVVYADWPTGLAVAGEQAGAQVVPGIEILIYQAAEQVRLMTGHSAPLEVMQQVGRKAASG